MYKEYIVANSQTITLFLRCFVVIAIFLSANSLLKTAKSLKKVKDFNSLKNYISFGYIIKCFRRSGVIITIYSVTRLFAAFSDYFMDAGVGLVSNITNYAFWIWFFIFVHSISKYLNNAVVQSQPPDQAT